MGYFWCSAGEYLGPDVFSAFIDDLLDIITTDTSIRLYADDTKLCKELH